MSSESGLSPASDDLTAKARIRDAAIRRYAADGLDAPLRAIAADAGVSAGLILHHFGSRAGLREACDLHVAALTRESKVSVLDPTGGGASFLSQMADVEGYAPVIGYVLRCLQAGGGQTTELVDRLAADGAAYLEDGVAAGTVRPSRDPATRAKVLTEMALGALLLQLPARQEHLDLTELPAWLNGYFQYIALPLLELFTEGLLADPTLLDAYLEATAGSTPAPADPASPPTAPQPPA